MITFLLQVLPERLLEGLGGAEEERLHCPLRAAERLRHVAVGEAGDPREEERRALFGRQLADRRLQLPRQLAARRALPGCDRRGAGELRALAAVVVAAPRLPAVPSPPPTASPGRFTSPTLAGAMRGRILREGGVASHTRAPADMRPRNTRRAAKLRPPEAGRRLPWAARSC